ncbi:MAG: hypothetical protein OCD02_02360 [Spirochaetaceae bacterium]
MNNCFYIIGVKHCGKSSVGKDLAHSLNLPFYDLDEIIEKSVNMSVRDFYKKEGKDSFQKQETNAILFLQKQLTGYICATGGGICDNGDAYKILEQTDNIYLNTSFETVYDRIIKNGIPAFLKSDDPKAEFNRLFLTRTKLYKNLSTIEINGNNKTQHQISLELITKVREL